jgi:hypothetical protein
MTSSEIFSWALVGVVVLGGAFFAWRWWSGRQADSQYARVKARADTDVHRVLQGKSFTVGTPSDFTEGNLQGHFGWLSGERAWGLRLGNPKSSLRSLEGTAVPVWILQGDGGTWARHPDGDVRLRAYNTDVSLVLPKGLKEGDQVRLGANADDRAHSAI